VAGETLRDAAKKAGYASHTGLYTAFASVEGIPVGEWLASAGLRVTKSRGRFKTAERLVRRGGLTLAEVAERSGYPSIRSLIRAFHTVHGLSPSKWRSRLSAGEKQVR
jgi:AraC-like DNA-binding protein